MEGIERPKIPFSNYCGCELKNNSASVSSASSSCTVEPAMVQKHSACRTAGSIRAASETIQDVLNPSVRCRRELKRCATSMIAAKHCRPIDIPRAVRLQIGISIFAVVLVKAKNNVCCRRCSGDERQRNNE